MKNIALPLLLASSARAQTAAQRKKMMMAQDHAFPKPILIADEMHPDGCVDAGTAVSGAKTALTNAEEKLSEATGLRAALVEAVEEAAAEKLAAIEAVIEQDASMAEALEADDAAQMDERDKKAALDGATIAESVAVAAAELALELKGVADTALEEAQEIQEAMDTALEEATAHQEHEAGQTETWTGKVESQEEDYDGKEGAIAGLEGLYNDEKDEYDPKQVTTEAKKALYDDYTSLTSKLTTSFTTSEGPLEAGTSGTVAELKEAAETTLTNTELNALTIDAGTWQTLAKATVAKLWQWINDAEAYSAAIGTNQLCDGTNGTAQGSAGAGASADLAACKTACEALTAWGGTDTMPTGAAATDGNGGGSNTICYGLSFDSAGAGSEVCKFYPSGLISAAAGSSGDAASTVCHSRTKSTTGEELVAAYEASAETEEEYLDMIAKLTAWGVQSNLVDDAQQAFNLANEYSTLIGEAKTTAEESKATYEGEYNEALEASEEAKEEMDSAEEDVDTKVSDTAASLVLLNSYKASLATQEDEEEAQDAIVVLATSDQEAQEETVEELETAAEEAAETNSEAIITEEEMEEAKETAQEEYTAATEAAEETEEALVTPLEELAGLRLAAVEATGALVEALGDEADQEAAIAEEQDLVDEAAEAHLAAVVECREARYDQYAETLAGEEQSRQTKLDDIETLIDDNPVPAVGTIGARCEKAVSNGTFRPKRNDLTCTGETVCCGASKIQVGNVIMTVETCQNDSETTYTYVAPRGPMETTMPTGTSYPFECIDGAQKLAAATSALAAAVYMLA